MIKVTLLAAGLLFMPATQAALEAVEQAYELTPGQLQLSGSGAGTGGSISLQPCPTCARITLGLTERTLWRIGQRGPLVTPGEFRTQWQKALAGSRESLVFVYYAPGTRTVTRVILSVAPPGNQP